MGGGVQQIFNQTEILLLALNARAKFSRARLLKLVPEIIATLQPLFAPGKRSGCVGCGWTGTGKRRNSRSRVTALGNESAHVLIGGFAAQTSCREERQQFRQTA